MCIYKNVDALTFDKTKFDLKSRQIEACRPSTIYERRPSLSLSHPFLLSLLSLASPRSCVCWTRRIQCLTFFICQPSRSTPLTLLWNLWKYTGAAVNLHGRLLIVNENTSHSYSLTFSWHIENFFDCCKIKCGKGITKLSSYACTNDVLLILTSWKNIDACPALVLTPSPFLPQPQVAGVDWCHPVLTTWAMCVFQG